MWLDWDQTAREGKTPSHVPGYFAERAGGPALVVDCRPADRRPSRDLAAFEATRRACALAGWEYRLVGALDPVATANLRWLAGYRHPRYGLPALARALRGQRLLLLPRWWTGRKGG
jgi:hypothetical protein